MTARWKHFAWDGFDMEIPADWDPGVLEHSADGGLYRLEDELRPRLFLRWRPLKGKTTFAPQAALEAHFERQAKALRKKRTEFEVELNVPLPGARRAFGPGYLGYRYRAGGNLAAGAAACCETCRRAYVLELTGTGEQVTAKLVERILLSFREHADGAVRRWEVYGVSADLPAHLACTGKRLEQGLVRLEFSGPGERAALVRWSLANVHLQGRDLTAFVRGQYAKVIAREGLQLVEATRGGHEAVALVVKRDTWARRLRARLRRRAPRTEPTYLACLVWHCERTNRLFAVEARGNVFLDPHALDERAGAVRCCSVEV